MHKISILSTATADPPYHRTTEEILPFVRKWLNGLPGRSVEKSIKIFEMAEIRERYSIMPPEEIFRQAGVGDKNDIYVEGMKVLTEKALRAAIEKAGLRAQDIGCLITISCTGFMIPSMDAYLVNRLRMKPDTLRLPVTEMGCAGGTSSMIYAHEYLKGNPGKNLAIVAFESPTATMQHTDKSMTNVVSCALFGDGVAAAILSSGVNRGPEIINSRMYHTYDEEDIMGFKMTNTGLSMILEATVPDKIESIFDDILDDFLAGNDLDMKDIDHLLFHPGGKKIIRLLEGKFEKTGKKLAVTKEILYNYGNMSSATIFYILDRYMNKNVRAGDLGLMLSFGPGFTTQLILIKWQ